MKNYMIMIILMSALPMSGAMTKQEIIAAWCKTHKHAQPPTPTASPLVQAINAEEDAEEGEPAENPTSLQDLHNDHNNDEE